MRDKTSTTYSRGVSKAHYATLHKGNHLLLGHLRNRYLFLFDLLVLPFATWLAFVIRLNPHDLLPYNVVIVMSMLVTALLKPLVFQLWGLYGYYWPFAGFDEALRIVAAALAAELLQTGVVFSLTHVTGVTPLPRSIPFLDLFLTLIFFAGPRFGLRWLYHRLHRRERRDSLTTQRVLIAGAGEAGLLTAREIQQNPALGFRPVGFVDDDPNKQWLRINGVQVVGRLEDIPALIQTRKVDQVFIAIPSAPPDVIRQITELCRSQGMTPSILPGMSQLVSGHVEMQRFRKVQLEDLLARQPIHTDTSGVQKLLKGRRILVTGAGGSIGSELCRQIARCEPAQLLLLGHGENSIFGITNELYRDFPALNVQPVIADIREVARLERIFERFQPEVIFHAAAHKHVPLMEDNPEEAVTNNVLGTRNLLDLAESHAVEVFVMISTDKAVRPTSVMGATKRVAEQLVQAAAHRTGRCFVAVRFGNVLGSRGSVVPYFQEQIERGGPVTVTHPEIKRFFMTIPEAVQLVLQAAILGRGGEIFVLDMGEPVKIVDLARDLIRLAGLREGQDIEIVFTGLRPGEKLFEELFLKEETHHRTAHEKVFVSQNGVCAFTDEKAAQIQKLIEAAYAGDSAVMLDLLHTLSAPHESKVA
ncbi:MAG: polysaccharide biosynthesis protein [Anaerolineae bacterium]|nr:polysaccharide biosynthesis protein [Anaerolineae bacterium]